MDKLARIGEGEGRPGWGEGVLVVGGSGEPILTQSLDCTDYRGSIETRAFIQLIENSCIH